LVHWDRNPVPAADASPVSGSTVQRRVRLLDGAHIIDRFLTRSAA